MISTLRDLHHYIWQSSPTKRIGAQKALSNCWSKALIETRWISRHSVRLITCLFLPRKMVLNRTHLRWRSESCSLRNGVCLVIVLTFVPPSRSKRRLLSLYFAISSSCSSPLDSCGFPRTRFYVSVRIMSGFSPLAIFSSVSQISFASWSGSVTLATSKRIQRWTSWTYLNTWKLAVSALIARSFEHRDAVTAPSAIDAWTDSIITVRGWTTASAREISLTFTYLLQFRVFIFSLCYSFLSSVSLTHFIMTS